MRTSGGVLALLTDAALRADIDRIGAAVGVRVLHADATAVEPKAFRAATVVLLDPVAAQSCAQHPGLPRPNVVVVTDAEPTTPTWAAAVAVGARHVVTLPAQEAQLVAVIGDADESQRETHPGGRVVAVIGGCGGAGASLLAAALAQSASRALLLDLDPWGGGIDLLMSADPEPGLRWPDLGVRGGRLAWSTVRAALPTLRGAAVLSAARHCHELAAGPVDAVIEAGRRGGATVVCDLPRRLTESTETALGAADLVVLASRCDLRSGAATAALAPVLSAINPNVGLVVRGPAPGGLRAAEIAELAAVPLLATVRADARLIDRVETDGLRLQRRCGLAVAARSILRTLTPENRRAA